MAKTGIEFMKRTALRLMALVFASFALSALPTPADAASRLKDIVEFEGVRDNMLVGYGLVVGLNNTGDTLKTGHFTKQSLQSMLNRMGVKPTDDGLDSKNVAAVMVTAALPAFARQGGALQVDGAKALCHLARLRLRHLARGRRRRRRRRRRRCRRRRRRRR